MNALIQTGKGKADGGKVGDHCGKVCGGICLFAEDAGLAMFREGGHNA
jgi:hypothetical protein